MNTDCPNTLSYWLFPRRLAWPLFMGFISFGPCPVPSWAASARETSSETVSPVFHVQTRWSTRTDLKREVQDLEKKRQNLKMQLDECKKRFSESEDSARLGREIRRKQGKRYARANRSSDSRWMIFIPWLAPEP